MTSFTSLMDSALTSEGDLSVSIPEDWMQGRSAYGGLQTSLALRAMHSLVPNSPIRSLQTNFIGPLAGDVRAEARVLRSGKNTTQVEAKLFGHDGLTTQVLGVFGSPRESEIRVRMSPKDLQPGQSIVFPFLPGITPNFTQQFAIRLRKGAMPFSGQETAETVYELDLKDSGPVTSELIATLADFVPPLGMSALTKPTFGSTLSWFLEFLSIPPANTPLENWRLDSELISADGGYSNQSSVLWSPGGTAVALSRQTMLVFG